MKLHVLQLDIQGTPQAWITPEQAVLHYATGTVAWEDGYEPLMIMRGGINVATGRQSILSVSPIIALSGQAATNLFDVPPTVTKAKLLRRDRFTCAYCGEIHRESDLQVEHILPESRGGGYTWMNLVIADRWCNAKKANRTPEEAGMPLLFLPYVPNRFEDFLLAGRNIRADVHEWLAARLPKHSRYAEWTAKLSTQAPVDCSAGAFSFDQLRQSHFQPPRLPLRNDIESSPRDLLNQLIFRTLRSLVQ